MVLYFSSNFPAISSMSPVSNRLLVVAIFSLLSSAAAAETAIIASATSRTNCLRYLLSIEITFLNTIDYDKKVLLTLSLTSLSTSSSRRLALSSGGPKNYIFSPAIDQGKMLKDRSILVTGGAGFIGSHLVERLLSENMVTVLDNFSSGRREHLAGHLKNPSFRLIEADIMDAQSA